MNGNQCEKFLKKITNKTIYIYGTGINAKRFFKVLQEHHLVNQVKAFLETEPKAEKSSFEGIQIIKPEFIAEMRSDAEDYYICVCTHKAVSGDIIAKLQSLKLKKYLFVTPYLNELELCGVEKALGYFKVGEIVKKNINDFFLVFRYLAIEQYEQKNEIGKQMYIKSLRLISSEETALKRWNAFIELYESIKKGGFSKERPVVLDKDGRIVDGAHRAAIAIYLKEDRIYGKQYQGVPDRDSSLLCDAYVKPEALHKLQLSEKELTLLYDTQKKMMKGYEIV